MLRKQKCSKKKVERERDDESIAPSVLALVQNNMMKLINYRKCYALFQQPATKYPMMNIVFYVFGLKYVPVVAEMVTQYQA